MRKQKAEMKLKDGVAVRDLEELERAFDPDAIMNHFRSGQLEEWLRDRYYDDEADAISAIAKDDPNAARKVCAALGVAYEDHFDKEFAARIREKRKQLQEMTSDVSIIENARNTAFNQQDLADLLDLDEPVIYLCGKKFTVPIRLENKRYIGVLGTPQIKIRADSEDELKRKHIVIENCQLPPMKKSEPPPAPVETRNSGAISSAFIAAVQEASSRRQPTQKRFFKPATPPGTGNRFGSKNFGW